jgi:hypothetical protein
MVSSYSVGAWGIKFPPRCKCGDDEVPIYTSGRVVVLYYCTYKRI